ncbi:extracellular solute-binding protein [Candidatus Woesebacteria bacterium]|nr:extracellular solute-binding protein [Candidatus Woesebacteria bacterium]
MPTPLPKPAAPPLPKTPGAVSPTTASTPVPPAVATPAGGSEQKITQPRPSLPQAPVTPVAPAQASQPRPSVAPISAASAGIPVSPVQQQQQVLAARPPIPTQPVRLQQPPQTLTALSSMASNRLPQGAGTVVQSPNPSSAPKLGSTPAAIPLTKNPQSPPPVQPVVVPQKSILRFLPIIGGAILLILVLGFVAFRYLGGSSSSGSVSLTNTSKPAASGKPSGSGSTSTTTKKITIEYWGLWEASDVMASVIADYERANPGVSIKYTKQSHRDYRTRLDTALGSDNGPDIFRFHASWVPMLRQELAPLPSSVMSSSEFQNTFYQVAVTQLQSNGQIVGIPLMYDGLALFYNTDIFKTAVLEPPKTWPELRTTASKLTLKEGNTLKRAGIAIGNATTVEHFSDILELLMLQNGADLTKPSSPEVRDALLFYTNFIKTDGVWDETLPSSTIAFARGDAAMMFAPSWRAHEVKATNPDLKFAVAPLPQLSDKRIAVASYWAEGVNSKSKNKEEAWKFIKYLSSAEVEKKLFAAQAGTRSFGELYSRKDLADSLAGDPVTSAFVQDAPYAQAWYLNSFTHDAGLNDQLIQYYKDAVTAILSGTTVEEAQTTLEQGVSQLLRQYAVPSSSTTAQ